MKTKLLLLCAMTTAGALQFAPTAAGQDDKVDRRSVVRWQSLSESERAKLRAAHDQALQDAQVRAAHERLMEARREFRDVMRPALLKADPSVQPILEKLHSGRRPRH